MVPHVRASSVAISSIRVWRSWFCWACIRPRSVSQYWKRSQTLSALPNWKEKTIELIIMIKVSIGSCQFKKKNCIYRWWCSNTSESPDSWLRSSWSMKWQLQPLAATCIVSHWIRPYRRVRQLVWLVVHAFYSVRIQCPCNAPILWWSIVWNRLAKPYATCPTCPYRQTERQWLRKSNWKVKVNQNREFNRENSASYLAILPYRIRSTHVGWNRLAVAVFSNRKSYQHSIARAISRTNEVQIGRKKK